MPKKFDLIDMEKMRAKLRKAEVENTYEMINRDPSVTEIYALVVDDKGETFLVHSEATIDRLCWAALEMQRAVMDYNDNETEEEYYGD